VLEHRARVISEAIHFCHEGTIGFGLTGDCTLVAISPACYVALVESGWIEHGRGAEGVVEEAASREDAQQEELRPECVLNDEGSRVQATGEHFHAYAPSARRKGAAKPLGPNIRDRPIYVRILVALSEVHHGNLVCQYARVCIRPEHLIATFLESFEDAADLEQCLQIHPPICHARKTAWKVICHQLLQSILL